MLPNWWAGFYEALKRHAFEDQGIVVAKVDDPRLSWVDREELKRIGAKLYGQPLR